jgi:hypothetical protein
VTGVQSTVKLRWQELVGVQACSSSDAWELAVDAWGERGALRGPHWPQLGAVERRTIRLGSKEWRRQRLELRRERVIVQEKPKGWREMDAAIDCEAPDTFYRVEEGGKTVP